MSLPIDNSLPATSSPGIVTDSRDSSDTLPMVGFSVDQLLRYIKRMLGGSVWQIELTDQDILDCIQDAMALFSQMCPQQRYWALAMSSNVHTYLENVDVGLGVTDCHFVQPVPTPTAVFYGNLVDPTPIFRVGVDEYDLFLRWRKTWMRVTSVQPDWLYDDSRRILFIHNPIERYYCAVFTYFPFRDTRNLPHYGAQWVKEYSMERSRLVYGEILAKFSGAVPGPLKDLQLDVAKRDKAEKKITELEEKLHRMQTLTPLSID